MPTNLSGCNRTWFTLLRGWWTRNRLVMMAKDKEKIAEW